MIVLAPVKNRRRYPTSKRILGVYLPSSIFELVREQARIEGTNPSAWAGRLVVKSLRRKGTTLRA